MSSFEAKLGSLFEEVVPFLLLLKLMREEYSQEWHDASSNIDTGQVRR
jgi:hypothetical protein